MTRKGLACALLSALLTLGGPVQGEDASMVTLMEFSDLEGWADDDHDAALSVFAQTCDRIKGFEWPQLCKVAQKKPDAKSFFELFFRPVLIEDGNAPLFTGYFEPELHGSRRRSDRYRFPIYAKPNDLEAGVPYYSRREIADGVLSGRGLEIAWVDDAVELFFLQVQGSGRIRLDDGTMTRVGYAGKNGHTYRSIGRELVRRGTYNEHQVSADVIKNWVRRNPVDGEELLNHNPSFVFFRERQDLHPELGPIGAMNRSITTMRSIAVDPKFTPLGAPVWIEKEGESPVRRLMIAQDTGSAIKGAQRADIFYGTGDAAGSEAGRIKDGGRMIVLLPIQTAYGLLEKASG
ncbi:murein transglycosylase A [Celeribacter sp.]|uniref:murein transglycosylase A n=1 Tax=Celeribacter sp. TaxID=1890673 RepID=UPI003A9404DF